MHRPIKCSQELHAAEAFNPCTEGVYCKAAPSLQKAFVIIVLAGNSLYSLIISFDLDII